MTDQIAKGTPVADLRSALGHRMTGTAIHGGYFNVPLINQVPMEGIPGELWQGGCIDGLSLPEDFDFVLSLYPWEEYKIGPKTEMLQVKMFDSLNQATEQIDDLASEVAEKLRDGKKLLVHCQAGLNRSGLVAGAALIKLGLKPDDAIYLLRGSRGTQEVLCNSAFVSYLETLA